jgi:hypothetical protein
MLAGSTAVSPAPGTGVTRCRGRSDLNAISKQVRAAKRRVPYPLLLYQHSREGGAAGHTPWPSIFGSSAPSRTLRLTRHVLKKAVARQSAVHVKVYKMRHTVGAAAFRSPISADPAEATCTPGASCPARGGFGPSFPPAIKLWPSDPASLIIAGQPTVRRQSRCDVVRC